MHDEEAAILQELVTEVAALRRQVAEQQATIARLEARKPPAETSVSRRRALKNLAAGLLAGAGVAVAVQPSTAEARFLPLPNTGAFIVAPLNAVTGTLASGNYGLVVVENSPLALVNLAEITSDDNNNCAILGFSDGNVGVLGESSTGTGIQGTSFTSRGVVADSTRGAPLKITPKPNTPVGQGYIPQQGDISVDTTTNKMWLYTSTGWKSVTFS
jgi:hypothetical protein